jgi:putative tryptophan/tyrosine transport system substrate-binding protein
MRRRDFIALLGGAAAGPLAARAQQPAMLVVGYVSPNSDPNPVSQRPFLQALAEAGFVDGKNVAIEYLSANGQYDRLPALTAELVRRQVAVIVTLGSAPASLAAKAATSTIPIVFGVADDPVSCLCQAARCPA